MVSASGAGNPLDLELCGELQMESCWISRGSKQLSLSLAMQPKPTTTTNPALWVRMYFGPRARCCFFSVGVHFVRI